MTPFLMARGSTQPIVEVRFSRTAFGSNPVEETSYQTDFRNRLVPALSKELSKEMPGYHLIVTFERVPSAKPSAHYVSEKGERIAYQEPNVLSFSYQLLDASNRVVGTGSTELAEAVSYVEPNKPEPQHREFKPETELVLNWAKGLRQYRS
jgi:hypothetical protein